jgi:DNA-binding transcriptional regulator YiaG
MTNIAAVLKSEISRLARKEVRGEIASLRKASSQQRASIAALRREVQQLHRRLRGAGKARVQKASQEASAPDESVQLRFRPAGVATHRKKLGLSAENYGALIGVSGQTIHHWEAGQRPRAKQLQALATVRGIGKREAAQRLAALAPAPKARAPKTRAPKARAPKARAPKARAPKARAPKARAPKAQGKTKPRGARARARA